MRAEDKKEIYGMLQQIDSWIQGVPSVTFGSVPQFTDDRENSREHDVLSSSLYASVTESSGFSDTEQKKDQDRLRQGSGRGNLDGQTSFSVQQGGDSAAGLLRRERIRENGTCPRKDERRGMWSAFHQ